MPDQPMEERIREALLAHWGHSCGLEECKCDCGEPVGHWGKGADMKAHAAHQAAIVAGIVRESMRPMTLVELADRDRPEQMAAARAKVRAERQASLSERIREAQEVAWAKGASSAGMNLMALQAAGINPNPYRKDAQ